MLECIYPATKEKTTIYKDVCTSLNDEEKAVKSQKYKLLKCPLSGKKTYTHSMS